MKAISKQATLITHINRVVAHRCAVALAFCFAVIAPSLATAQSAADYARLSEGMKGLEARVAALESENKQAKKENRSCSGRGQCPAARSASCATTASAAAVCANSHLDCGCHRGRARAIRHGS